GHRRRGRRGRALGGRAHGRARDRSRGGEGPGRAGLGDRRGRERAAQASLAPRVKPSWPLDRPRLRSLTIGWPARYAWPPAHNWLRSIQTGIRSHGVAVERREIAQPTTTGAVVILEAGAGRRRERFAVDFED